MRPLMREACQRPSTGPLTMTTICPKCSHIRPADTQAPAWQCPGCGIAYAKAGAATEPQPTARRAGYGAVPARAGLPWRLLLTGLAVVAGLWWGHQAHLDKRGLGGGATDEATVRQLAATVRAEQIVMYSTTECGYCTQARAWLDSHGFAFRECNMSHERRCEDEFHALGATGTPYLIVRGPRGEHHMKEGFDSDEFLAALKA
jgi:glutaredoxin